jgi:hypothetical protein
VLGEVRYEGCDGVGLDKLKEQVTLAEKTSRRPARRQHRGCQLQQYYLGEGTPTPG